MNWGDSDFIIFNENVLNALSVLSKRDFFPPKSQFQSKCLKIAYILTSPWHKDWLPYLFRPKKQTNPFLKPNITAKTYIFQGMKLVMFLALQRHYKLLILVSLVQMQRKTAEEKKVNWVQTGPGGLSQGFGIKIIQIVCLSADTEFSRRPRALQQAEETQGKQASSCFKYYASYRLVECQYLQNSLSSLIF